MGKFYFPQDLRNESKNTRPEIIIHRIWADTHAFENIVKGVRIHYEFSVKYAKGKKCVVSSCFYKKDNTPLMDKNGQYASSDGRVNICEACTIPRDPMRFDAFTMFIPAYELHTFIPQVLSIYVWFIIDGDVIEFSDKSSFYFSLI